jgi:type I restriction enzyme R subunit
LKGAPILPKFIDPSSSYQLSRQSKENNNITRLTISILRKLIDSEIRIKLRRNITRYGSFRERLEKTIRAYHNRALESAKTIEEQIKLAREIKESIKVGEELRLSEEEFAFYDALSCGKEFVMADEELKKLVKELVKSIKNNLSIDWTELESVRSKVRVAVKRTLKIHGLSPVKYTSTTDLIMKQAQALYENWPTLEYGFTSEDL